MSAAPGRPKQARTAGLQAEGTPVSAFALELKNVRKSFARSEIIRGANLQVLRGKCYALIGPNGAGKSTLFNLISGEFGISSGDIVMNGHSIAGLRPFEINRRGLSRSFQISNLFHRLTVHENLLCAVLWSLGYRYSFWHRIPALLNAHERANAVMEQIGLQRRRSVAAGLLTYAEQRALEIGITIASGSEVILLDEPTAGMSRSESDAMVDLIRKVTTGKTLLVVEHDMGVVFGLADKIAVLVYGEVIACAEPAEIRTNAAVQQAYLGAHAEDELDGEAVS